MPIYEYRCDACGSQREMFVRSTTATRPSCQTCRTRMRRVISPTSFILKGSGWYVTDYPSDARKKGLAGEKPPEPAAAGEAAKKEPAAAEKKPVQTVATPPSHAGKGVKKPKSQP